MMTRLTSFVTPVVLAAMLGCSGGQQEAPAEEAGVAGDEVATSDTPDSVASAPTAEAPAPDAPAAGVVQHSFNQRPADVTVMMSTSRGKYDGSYTTSQVASICGEVPAELNFAAVPAFIVEFPHEPGDLSVTNVSFGSTALVGGVTTTTKFRLSVGVKSPQIGQPAQYVLHTDQPKMTGTATLTMPSAGTVTLKVDGVNDRGETVSLTLVCGPAPRA